VFAQIKTEMSDFDKACAGGGKTAVQMHSGSRKKTSSVFIPSDFLLPQISRSDLSVFP
jgi:hypothetical protein